MSRVGERLAVTFRGYLADQRDRDDPVGDLARTAFAGSPSCPHGCRFTSWQQLLTHLAHEHDPTPETFSAARRAQKEFRARGWGSP